MDRLMSCFETKGGLVDGWRKKADRQINKQTLHGYMDKVGLRNHLTDSLDDR